jgi:uncharacterized NAD(P)/FAD-binding protein YdhS
VTTERIAILGGGASGTLLAVELLRRADRPLEIVLVEPRSSLGRGPAYTTPFPVHVMNVPAGRLSARPEDPGHFVAWLHERHPELAASPFVERRLYGRYLEDVLAEARRAAHPHVRLDHMQDEVTDVRPADARVEIVLSCAPPFRADRVVLALGNLPPDALARIAPDGRDPVRFVRDPWPPGALDFPDPGGDVLVLGTGLTAVDVVLGLRHRGHEGRVLAVSRRGFLPREHASVPDGHGPFAPAWDLPVPVSLRSLMAEVRLQIRRARAVGGDFRVVVDSLRPRTQALWRGLPPADRARFLRHVQPFWDVHRHRMAPQVSETLRSLLSARALTILAGNVEAVEEGTSTLHARIRPRGADQPVVMEVRHVVDCTGPAPVRRTTHPLLRRMLDTGLVRTDALGLGLDVTPDGRLVSLANPRGDRLFAMGPLLKGALWETTAMAEIRGQAADLARTLVGRTALSGEKERPVSLRSARAEP